MNKLIVYILLVVLTIWGVPVAAAQQNAGHGDHASKDAKAASRGFLHAATVEGVRAEFEIMTLASMNMKDPGGDTHHIMVKLFRDESGEAIPDAVGRVKVIAPDKREKVADLKDYGDVFAANFTADQTGKYGVICLLKVDGKKLLYKFWYHNM